MHGQRRAAWVPTGVRMALALGWLTAGCGAGAPVEAYDLSGVVEVELEERTAPAPLGDATVTFTSDTGLVTQTTSDDDGRYEMQVLTDVQFGQVRAERTGFTTSEHTVYFDRPERRIDFVLRPAAE